MLIAILEDNPEHARTTLDVVQRLNHRGVVFGSSQALLRGLQQENFDLFVLDWELKETTGLEVLCYLRGELHLHVPVIFLTSRNGEQDIVQALHAGADDYCTKPLREVEFSARLQALLRRAYPTAANPNEDQVLHGYEFSPGAQSVRWHGGQIELSDKEYKLAVYLFSHADQAISRERLMLHVWGHENTLSSRTLDVHISRLRQHLKISATSPHIRLRSIHGFGYRLSILDSSS